MRRGRDKSPSDGEQVLARELCRGGGERTHHPERAATVDHRLQNRAERFDVQPERHRREFLLKRRHGGGEPFERKHHVHHDAQLRLEAVGQALRAGLENIHPADHRAGFRKKRHAFPGQDRRAARPIEQFDAELGLEIRQRLTDDGLRSAQLARARREASGIGRGDERAQLIQRNSIKHLSSRTMVYI
jgi:hypothetical protein